MNTPRVTVFVVDVLGREDGIYLFATESDASRFEAAVIGAGGSCVVREETVCHASETAALIEAEREDGR